MVSTKTSFILYAAMVIYLLIKSGVGFKRSWFVPLFGLYFGLVGATLFFDFLNGNASGIVETKLPLYKLIWQALYFHGGKVMYGGYFGQMFGMVVASLLCWNNRKILSKYLDVSAISVILLFSFWRLMCFKSSCCYGIPCNFWGVSFPLSKTGAYLELSKLHPELVANRMTVPLLPTQLISSAGDLIIFIFLFYIFCGKKLFYPYFYLFAASFLYGIGRFTIEFFRIDVREFWGVLSMSQWLSLFLIVVSSVFFIKNRREIIKAYKETNV